MAEKVATAQAPNQSDSPQVAHFKFQEEQLSEKLARVKAMSDEEFGPADKGHNRQEAIRRAESALAEVRRELKKATK